MSDYMIEFAKVNKWYGNQFHVLRDIDLQVRKGERIVICGPSGSGKSTLLNMLGLLDQTNSGSYRFAGQELTTLPEEARAKVRREQIGFIFQSFHLIPRLTASENVELPLMLMVSTQSIMIM